MFKDFGAFIKQAREIGGRVRDLGDQLRNRRVTGGAAGGMVEIEMNGLVEVLRCRIDSGLIKQGDAELLEDLVVAATNQAISKAKQIHAETARSLTGGLPLPGLEEALSKFLEAGGNLDEEPGADGGGQSDHGIQPDEWGEKETDQRGGTQ